ncbi:hypothetical protein HPP92_007141 [Vanilla planifolia]|uniref:Uncharacterized protein n=1 Tax=Vanilla planifolia TaxID=51239 RepID=A0A835R9X3_VANPL|nr:hypothetical protein HPP92_007141 [Vanilla planifolia]
MIVGFHFLFSVRIKVFAFHSYLGENQTELGSLAFTCLTKNRKCQTVIDILAKHAFDHIDRFTLQQRQAIQKLWASIKEQQIRRKQGKSVTGKLDMNAFEWLQEKYANEKISIRHSVGGGGERRAEQWLG